MVSRYGGEKQIQLYIKNQGMNYKTDYKKISVSSSVDLFSGSGG
jgi:hypothetical protein